MSELVKDPICGMEFEPENAARVIERDGVTYYFCAEGCARAFEAGEAPHAGQMA